MQGNSNDAKQKERFSSAELYVAFNCTESHGTVHLRRWSGTINVAYEEVNSISRASHQTADWLS